jgi:hypothetical protein
VNGAAAFINAIDRDLDLIAGLLVNNRLVPRFAGKLRFCLVELPGTHLWIVLKAQRRAHKNEGDC